MTNENLDKYNILHKPGLDYDKKYDSTNVSQEVEENEQYQQQPILDNIISNIGGINSLLPLLPSDMQEIIKNPLTIIEQITGDFEEPKHTTIDEILKVLPQDNKGNIENILPTGPFRDEPERFDIVINNNNKVDIIKDKYNSDMISIINDYLDKLNKVLIKYVNNIIPSINTIGSDKFLKVLSQYTVESKNVSVNYKHLSDLIIKSQLGRKMKTQFYLKMFNVDKTITHIRACKIIVEQQIRYYEAQYDKATTYNSAINNRLLENSRLTYDVKYKENFTNLYKYLNSSVIVLNECIQMLINEVQSKAILIEKEGNNLW